MENLEIRFLPLNTEARAAEAKGEKTLAGYAAVFASPSQDLGGFTETIAPGAFKRSLAAIASGDLSVQALWHHDWSKPLGSTRGGKLKLYEDKHGLAFELDTARMTTAQIDTARDNDAAMSFGFIVREQTWEEREDGTIHRTISDVDLHEVSITVNPAYRATEASLRSLDAFKAERATVEEVVVEDTVEEDVRQDFKAHNELQLRLRLANLS